MSRRLHNYSVLSPWLMVVDNTNGIITFTDPLVGDKYFIKRPNVSIRNERICCSRFGWLLFASDYSPMVILNPFTGNIHKLPYCPRDLDSVCFSAPPTSPKCMVVGFSGGGTCACVCICIHFIGRERAWDTIRLKFVGGTPNRFRFPIFSGQDLYVLCDRGELYVFKNLFKLQDYYYEKVVGARDCEGDFYLVKRGQQFLLVIVGKSGGPVRVFEPNYHTKKWERIRCLGKFMIYICGTTCLCVEAKSPEMQNKIFFPRLDFEDGKIVFYSLETCRYQRFLGKRVEEIIRVGMEVVFPHAWIVPTWS